jgi:tetratricopeptide (TPR) repeat protein
MFESAEPYDVRFLEYFARLGRGYVNTLKPSQKVPDPKKVELAKIKVEQAMREIVDGQSEFAETFINAAYSDEPATVVWGLGMTVWSSAGAIMNDELRRKGRSILELAARSRPGNRLLLRALASMARHDRNFPKAHKFLDMMLKLDPFDFDAVDDKIKLYMLQEEFQRAHKVLAKALRKWPDDETLKETQIEFLESSKQCSKCGRYIRVEAPFCPKCKASFL